MSPTIHSQIEALTKQMVQQSTRALIFFSLAWACLTIGVFTFNPVGPGGITFLCLGLPCVVLSISYFVRYWRTSKHIKHLRQEHPSSSSSSSRPS